MVEGCGSQFPAGKESKNVELFLGNAAMAMFPSTTAVTVAGGIQCPLDGVPRMRKRPIGDLVVGLKQLGADFDCSAPNCPFSFFMSVERVAFQEESASYLLAGAAITGGTITVEVCGTSTLRGDVKFAEVLETMGSKVKWKENSVTVTGPSLGSSKHLLAIDVNMNKMPDCLDLGGGCTFVDGPTATRDVASWRVKETWRMIAICTELRKLGATVEGPDYCVITPPEKLNVTEIDTYADLRMAMALSLAACGDVSVTIKDPGCTQKTFP